jgi:sugar fermentation stimulation protein A
MTEVEAPNKITATFIERPNRFVIRAERHDTGEAIEAFCPNTSRLIGLLEDDPDLWLTRNDDPNRKTDYTVRRIRDRDHWVGIEAARANEFFHHFLTENPVTPFTDWVNWEREVEYGDSQLDFRGVDRDDRRHWTEVKSLSSRGKDNQSAFFSGTPSKRGWRHLRELSDAVQAGDRAHCVFVVQRPDVVQLAPGAPTHEKWYRHLRDARDRGVAIHAFRCHFQASRLPRLDPIPVIL